MKNLTMNLYFFIKIILIDQNMAFIGFINHFFFIHFLFNLLKLLKQEKFILTYLFLKPKLLLFKFHVYFLPVIAQL